MFLEAETENVKRSKQEPIKNKVEEKNADRKITEKDMDELMKQYKNKTTGFI